MREMLLDLVRHTGGLGFLETVKVTGDENETKLESMDNNRLVILKAKLKKPEPQFIGEFGMGRLNILQGFLGFANYQANGSSISIKRKEHNETLVPEELIFKDAEGQTSTYRFMSSELIPDQAKFLGVSWDVEVTPSRSKILEFIQLANILSSIEKYFLVKTVDGSLRFYIGDEYAATDRSAVVIDAKVSGELRGDLYWDITPIAPILKLGLDENMQLQFTNKGAFQIAMETPIAEYNYIFPAHRK